VTNVTNVMNALTSDMLNDCGKFMRLCNYMSILWRRHIVFIIFILTERTRFFTDTAPAEQEIRIV